MNKGEVAQNQYGVGCRTGLNYDTFGHQKCIRNINIAGRSNREVMRCGYLSGNINILNRNQIEHIKKLSEEIEDLGLEYFYSTNPVRMESQVEICKPMDLARFIEHTSVGADATKEQIAILCDEAKKFHFLGVCVNPFFVKEAVQKLKGTTCIVVSVVGFPLGANLTKIKVEEAKESLKNGANELDMVISIGALKSRDYSIVYNDIRSVVEIARPFPVKVIVESGLLNEDEKIRACLLALRAGASFIKTSSGFAFVKTPNGFENRGATVDDVRLIKSVVGNKMGIKASGGITDFKHAKDFIDAGATRIGCSASISIVTNSQPELLGHKAMNFN